ncbi:MAG: membrane protein insertase YidC, partial [Alphaproteobacteria bacterium]|nr:membrane protein insertase YidC [Alphaproteobacteria bacterium]
MSDQKNLFLAIIASVAILMGFQLFYELPREEARQAALKRQEQMQQQQPATPGTETAAPVPLPGGGAVPQAGQAAPAQAAVPTREGAIAAAPRLKIEGKRVHGSISLRGGRIDDITLADYRVDTKPGSAEIVLFSPAGGPSPYYAEFGWTTVPGASIRLPGADADWTADRPALKAGEPVTLSWNNGEGLIFQRIIAIDENYLFTVTQRVKNESGAPVTLFPYGLISRHGTPTTLGFYILHEGPLAVLQDKLIEHSYSDLREKGRLTQESTGGWIGITDKYWLAALVPDQKQPVQASFAHTLAGANENRYQVDFLGEGMVVAPGASVETRARLFAGAKETNLIDAYEANYDIRRFDLSIDWGWFYFLTKPIFHAIAYLYKLLGNFGLAILGLTVIIKMLFLPLAYKSYVAMSAMKKLQPKMM